MSFWALNIEVVSDREFPSLESQIRHSVSLESQIRNSLNFFFGNGLTLIVDNLSLMAAVKNVLTMLLNESNIEVNIQIW